jgi:hypothetical protein
MSTTEAFTVRDMPSEARDFEYRSVSTAAIASVVFGVLSLVIFLAGRDSFEASLMLAPLPIIGLVMGLRGWSRVRRNPDQFTGHKLALAGSLLSIVCLVGGLSFSGYVYATEVWPGYVRTSFENLRPDEVEERGGKVVPPEVMALDGKKVFIKGYIRPGTENFRQNATRFLLVRDNNQCCFGDITTVKYYDQVKVDTVGRLTVDCSSKLFRLGGILRVFPDNAYKGPGAPVFALEADKAE